MPWVVLKTPAQRNLWESSKNDIRALRAKSGKKRVVSYPQVVSLYRKLKLQQGLGIRPEQMGLY